MNQMIRFECGQEERMGEPLGPFDYVQITYEAIRVEDQSAPGGERVLAQCVNGWWIDAEGQRWSDVVLFPHVEPSVALTDAYDALKGIWDVLPPIDPAHPNMKRYDAVRAAI